MTNDRNILSMHWLYLCCTATVLLAGGCGDRQAPKYERLNKRIVADLFEAIEQQDHELALRKLERLATVRPDVELTYYLERELQDDRSLITVNDLLRHGKYEAAHAALKAAIRDTGESDRLDAALAQLAGLLAISNYQAAMPYDDPMTAARAVADLPSRRLWEHQAYNAWQKAQTKHVATLVQRQRLRLQQELLAEIDLALCLDSTRVPTSARPVCCDCDRSGTYRTVAAITQRFAADLRNDRHCGQSLVRSAAVQPLHLWQQRTAEEYPDHNRRSDTGDLLRHATRGIRRVCQAVIHRGFPPFETSAHRDP